MRGAGWMSLFTLVVVLALVAFGAYVLYLRIDSDMPWFWWFR